MHNKFELTLTNVDASVCVIVESPNMGQSQYQRNHCHDNNGAALAGSISLVMVAGLFPLCAALRVTWAPPLTTKLYTVAVSLFCLVHCTVDQWMTTGECTDPDGRTNGRNGQFQRRFADHLDSSEVGMRPRRPFLVRLQRVAIVAGGHLVSSTENHLRKTYCDVGWWEEYNWQWRPFYEFKIILYIYAYKLYMW